MYTHYRTMRTALLVPGSQWASVALEFKSRCIRVDVLCHGGEKKWTGLGIARDIFTSSAIISSRTSTSLVKILLPMGVYRHFSSFTLISWHCERWYGMNGKKKKKLVSVDLRGIASCDLLARVPEHGGLDRRHGWTIIYRKHEFTLISHGIYRKNMTFSALLFGKKWRGPIFHSIR